MERESPDQRPTLGTVPSALAFLPLCKFPPVPKKATGQGKRSLQQHPFGSSCGRGHGPAAAPASAPSPTAICCPDLALLLACGMATKSLGQLELLALGSDLHLGAFCTAAALAWLQAVVLRSF